MLERVYTSRYRARAAHFTAQRRQRGQNCRRMVSKSSYTVTLLASPRSSRRRRALNDPQRTGRFLWGDAHVARRTATPIVHVMFADQPHFTSPTLSPSAAINLPPEASVNASLFACQCPCSPTSSCSPVAQRHGLLQADASFSGQMMRPRPGTMRTRWWNCFWIAFRSSKMSA